MSALLRLLLVTVPALAAAVSIAVLIWWIGPMLKVGALAPLESELARATLIGLLLLVLALRWAWRRWRARRASSNLTDGLMRAAPKALSMKSKKRWTLGFATPLPRSKKCACMRPAATLVGAIGCHCRAAVTFTTFLGICLSAPLVQARPQR